MPSSPLAERILRFINARGAEPRGLKELAEAMGIGADEQGDFHAACKALMKSGRIVLGTRNTVTLPDPPRKFTGTFRANPRGFGFVVPDIAHAHGDLYVPAHDTAGAMTGDRVAVEVIKRGKRGDRMRFEGRVAEILQRNQNRFVGALQRQAGRWFVVPDGSTLHAPIVIDDPTAKRAAPGDQVVVEIVRFPTERSPARGVIVKTLGPQGDPGVDALSVIEQFGLPGEFPDAPVNEARHTVAAYSPEEAARGREDLRAATIITIDPSDAKDFDDAISLERTHARWELGIHIADVSHFVPAGGALDREARDRANSVYLPQMVIPMLPEVLSNGLCSLQERQPRLTKSVFITYDSKGAVQKARFANSIIRSTKRLSYEQASAALGGKSGRMSAKVLHLLRDMEELARLIQARRRREGMLTLHIPDVELVLDDKGRIVDVTEEDRSFSHTIIEMFMIEANEAVARLLASRRMPYLRRIHESSAKLYDGTLRRMVRFMGFDLPSRPAHHDLQHLLEAVEGQDHAYAVNLAILRSMEQAEYSPRAEGHFALASEHYCHFTSPIRRYPDLTVHRLLDRVLKEDGLALPPVAGFEELEALGSHCSANERRAEAAERELKTILILRLLESRLGETFEGVVTGIAQLGIFVQLDRYLAEGLIRFEHLGEDWWEVDAEHGLAVGQRSGRRVRIGDRIRVTLVRVNIPLRQMDLALADGFWSGPQEKMGKKSRPHVPSPGRAKGSRKGERRGRRGMGKHSRSARRHRR